MDPKEVTAVDAIDIEEYAKRGEAPPKSKRYRIRIDDERFVVEQPTISGIELLKLVKKAPDKWRVYQHIRREQGKEVQPDETVDLTTPGIERFTTIRKQNTDGKGRRDFRLPASDEQHLDDVGYRYETIQESGKQWLVVQDFQIPEGFAPRKATVALLIPPAYPAAEIDMAWFDPGLSRGDDKPIPSLVAEACMGKSWQRWSRHRPQDAKWRVGFDDVSTHLLLVHSWLQDELKR